MIGAAPVTAVDASARPQSPTGGQPLYRCECGHELQVFGRDRHRVYFELTNTSLDDPVMDRVCPECGRYLPGKS